MSDKYILFGIVDSEIFEKRFKNIEEVNNYLAETTPNEIKYNRIRLYNLNSELTELRPEINYKIEVK